MHVHVLGTSHVSKRSIAAIKKAVKDIEPTVIAVELDKQRLASLLSKKKQKISFKMLKQLGPKAFIFALLGQLSQNTIGAKLGVAPGSDMLQGVKLAQKNNLKIALIDQPIHITLKKLNAAMKFSDFIRMITDTLQAMLFPKTFAKKYKISAKIIDADPNAVDHAVQYMKERFPGMYDVLVHQRNEYMVRQLQQLHEESVLAIVGAGHVKGIQALLENPEPTYKIHGTTGAKVE